MYKLGSRVLLVLIYIFTKINVKHFILQCRNNLKDTNGPDLRSQGLCLVPISSTFPVAAETTTEFWTPTFGGAFC